MQFKVAFLEEKETDLNLYFRMALLINQLIYLREEKIQICNSSAFICNKMF